jgi:chromosome segregation ATPase
MLQQMTKEMNQLKKSCLLLEEEKSTIMERARERGLAHESELFDKIDGLEEKNLRLSTKLNEAERLLKNASSELDHLQTAHGTEMDSKLQEFSSILNDMENAHQQSLNDLEGRLIAEKEADLQRQLRGWNSMCATAIHAIDSVRTHASAAAVMSDDQEILNDMDMAVFPSSVGADIPTALLAVSPSRAIQWESGSSGWEAMRVVLSALCESILATSTERSRRWRDSYGAAGRKWEESFRRQKAEHKKEIARITSEYDMKMEQGLVARNEMKRKLGEEERKRLGLENVVDVLEQKHQSLQHDHRMQMQESTERFHVERKIMADEIASLCRDLKSKEAALEAEQAEVTALRQHRQKAAQKEEARLSEHATATEAAICKWKEKNGRLKAAFDQERADFESELAQVKGEANRHANQWRETIRECSSLKKEGDMRIHALEAKVGELSGENRALQQQLAQVALQGGALEKGLTDLLQQKENRNRQRQKKSSDSSDDDGHAIKAVEALLDIIALQQRQQRRTGRHIHPSSSSRKSAT